MVDMSFVMLDACAEMICSSADNLVERLVMMAVRMDVLVVCAAMACSPILKREERPAAAVDILATTVDRVFAALACVAISCSSVLRRDESPVMAAEVVVKLLRVVALSALNMDRALL